MASPNHTKMEASPLVRSKAVDGFPLDSRVRLRCWSSVTWIACSWHKEPLKCWGSQGHADVDASDHGGTQLGPRATSYARGAQFIDEPGVFSDNLVTARAWRDNAPLRGRF